MGQAERSQAQEQTRQPRAHPQAPRGQGVSCAEVSPVASDVGFRARMSPGRGRQVQGHPVSRCPRCWALAQTARHSRASAAEATSAWTEVTDTPEPARLSRAAAP